MAHLVAILEGAGDDDTVIGAGGHDMISGGVWSDILDALDLAMIVCGAMMVKTPFRRPARRWAIRETVFVGSKNFTNKVARKPLWVSAARNRSRKTGCRNMANGRRSNGPSKPRLRAKGKPHGSFGGKVSRCRRRACGRFGCATILSTAEGAGGPRRPGGRPLPTEEQMAAPEKAKRHKEAHGEVESHRPGYLGSQNTCDAGTMKGAGRIYRQTFVDTHARVARRIRMNIGKIQDADTLKVRLKRNRGGKPLCEIEEGFAATLTQGDTFLIGGANRTL